MANRNQRRKRAKVKAERDVILAQVASDIERKAAIIRANLTGNRGKMETVTVAIRLNVKSGKATPVTQKRRILSPSYGTDSAMKVLRNAGPSNNANAEIARVCGERYRALTAK